MQFNTEELFIRKASEADLEQLDLVRESIKYIANWMSIKADELDGTIKHRFYNGWDLPPNYSNEAYQLLTIEKQNGSIIGYLALTHKYPDANCIWVSMLAINPSYQGKNYGKQVVLELINYLKNNPILNYKKIALSVDLKNWPAVNFWISAGFKDIVKYLGDKTYSDKNFAKIVLERHI